VKTKRITANAPVKPESGSVPERAKRHRPGLGSPTRAVAVGVRNDVSRLGAFMSTKEAPALVVHATAKSTPPWDFEMEKGRDIPAGNAPETLDEIDARWIADAIQLHCHEAVNISRLSIERLNATNSTVARLHIAGSVDGRPLPPTLFLKLCPSGHKFLGASELTYYTRDYQALLNAPIVSCCAAVGRHDLALADSHGAGYALLLTDLTASHADNKFIDPTGPHAACLGHALGRLHAYRWGANADPEGPHDLDAELDRYLAYVSRGMVPMLDALGDALDGASRELIYRVFEKSFASIRNRVREGDGLTLVHGDPNPTNVLTPKSPGPVRDARSLFLIDRQPFDWSLRLWLGASDLVYASVPYWPISQRRAHERALLEGYFTALVENGISDYSWDRLLDDWRICLCHALMVAPVWGADPNTRDNMRWLWEKQLWRALAAIRDWDH
jgi:hypothetical protein